MDDNQNHTGYHSPTSSSDFTVSSRSILDMPVEGSRLAPKVFKGDAADVEPLIRKFERLATLNGLTDRDKCDTILDYCSRKVRETIEGFESHQDGDWTQLKEDIRVSWNADLESKRFRIRDLETYLIKARMEPILELRDWRSYKRNFVRIAGWLRRQGKLTTKEYAYYLWTGLHPTFRRRLEARILLEKPDHNMAEPFTPESIDKAAMALLSMDRFDTERLSIERKLASKFGDDSDDEEYGSLQEAVGIPQHGNKKAQALNFEEDSNDSEPDELEMHRRRMREEYQKQQAKPTTDKPSTSNVKQPRNRTDDADFNALMDKMAHLSIDDKEYSVAYIKAARIDPSVALYCPKPLVRQPPVNYEHEVPRGVPPHMGRPDVNRFLSRRPAPQGSGCFGCGESGHIMNLCPKLQDYLSQGRVLRDYRGRITDKEGCVVRRQEGETIAQAIERQFPPPRVNFITYGGPTEEETVQSYIQEIADEDSEEETADVAVYPVDRGTKDTRTYRKQVFDGVRVPRIEKGKQREAASTSKPPPIRYPMQRLKPVETQPDTFDPNNDIEMVEDRTQVQKKKAPAPEQPTTEKTKWVPRTSEVSKNVDPAKIAEKLLDLPVTLQVRDIAGASREVASSLIDMLKLKKAETVPVAALAPMSHLVTSRAGPLIQLEMECNFKPVSFIVDTGSQINIISEKVCKNIVRRPINTAEAITMGDANGGSGRLLGSVEDIPLKLGHIKTPIMAYVAENPPFDGLLGRPWQKAHKIGIEEREDGTYLTFPTARGFPKSELLVNPQEAQDTEAGLTIQTDNLDPPNDCNEDYGSTPDLGSDVDESSEEESDSLPTPSDNEDQFKGITW
ncbi:hypothetical protein C8Q78DRAFT_1077692 [Trametes maxima]|nr:hypothetical protein C8Q78DRAFT_1077692 [Trametes maxima]